MIYNPLFKIRIFQLADLNSNSHIYIYFIDSDQFYMK